MKEFVPFSPEEKEIVETIKQKLAKASKDEEFTSLYNNELALEELVRSITLYPPIFSEQHLGNTSRSISTLIDNLCVDDLMDLVFRKPTKAILGDGFAVAKVNFFYMLLYLCRESKDLSCSKDIIISIISHNVYTMMAEEVFISIISDRTISMHVRTNAAYLLANIWEYRLDHGVKEFTPILNSLWEARKNMRPSFGTLFGVSELFLLSEKADPMCLEFLERDELQQSEIESLQEFLMGLTYEEMEKLNKEMTMRNMASINGEQIHSILRKETNYPTYISDDPRELYRSFRHRKNNALFRSRANIKGPHKTIEEYIMCYLLSRPEIMF